MTELVPRITYSPDGILGLRQEIRQSVGRTLFTDLEILACMPGYEVAEVDSFVELRVDVPRQLTEEHPGYRCVQAEHLLKNIARFVSSEADNQDNVFSLDYWGTRGAKGVIYPHFQRWLNSGNLDETMAKHAIESMALPYDERAAKTARREFRFDVEGADVRIGEGGFTIGITSRREPFGLTVFDADTGNSKRGTVEWNWVNLMTIGSCACWGADGMDREDVHIAPPSQRLYEMNPHNVDGANQSLSLALGAASLAYYAVQYEGTEDILVHAEWRER